MIGIVRQISSGLQIKFEILKEDKILYTATQPVPKQAESVEIQNKRALRMFGREGELFFSTRHSVVDNLLEEIKSLSYTRVAQQRCNKYEIVHKGIHIGAFYDQKKMIEDFKYLLEYKGQMIEIRDIRAGKKIVLAVFLGKRQVAELTKLAGVSKNIGAYTIHLMDEYKHFFEVLAFFLVYYNYKDYRNIGMYKIEEHKIYELSYTSKNHPYDDTFIEKNLGIDIANDFKKQLKNGYEFEGFIKIIAVALGIIVTVLSMVSVMN